MTSEPSLSAWTFSAVPAWREAVLQRLHERPPRVSGGDAHEAERWGLDALGATGQRIKTFRQPRPQQTFAADPKRDAQTSRLWAAWLSGDTESVWFGWPKLFLPAVARGVSGVLRSRNYSLHDQGRHLATVRDELPMMMLGWSGLPPGWTQVAARVLERSGAPPVEALARALSREGGGVVADCAARRGHQPETLRVAYPAAASHEARALALRRALTDDPTVLVRLADLHIALRLVDRWHEGESLDEEGTWWVVKANDGRARARLRSVLAADPEVLKQVLTLDCLYARTEAVMTGWAIDWASQLHKRRWEAPTGEPVDAPCELDPTPALDDDGWRALRAWFTLVCLKGRHDDLRAWVWEGRGNSGGSWGRLLAYHLPVQLRGPPDGERSGRGLAAVRAHLSEGWERLLDEVLPVLQRVGACESDGEGLEARVREVLASLAHPDVSWPSRAYGAVVRQTQVAALTLRSWKEDR
jgi:hypothetical protein